MQMNHEPWSTTLAPWLTVLSEDTGLSDIKQHATVHAYEQLSIGAPQGLYPALTALIAAHRHVAVITASSREAEEFTHAAQSWWPGNPTQVALLPAWETLPHERLSPRADTVAQRMTIFRRLQHPEPDNELLSDISVLVMPIRSLLQPISQGLGEITPLIFSPGKKLAIDEAEKVLRENAYQKVDLVVDRGQYARRSHMIDLFVPTAAHAVRIQFNDTSIVSLHEFHVSDQRTYNDPLHALWATPCRELALTQAIKDRARSLITVLPSASDLLQSIAQGIPAEGMESLLPVLVDHLDTVPALLPDDTLILIINGEKVRQATADLIKTSNEFLSASWHVAASGKDQLVPLDFKRANFLSLEQCAHSFQQHHHPVWTLTEPNDTDDDYISTAHSSMDILETRDKSLYTISDSASLHELVLTAPNETALTRIKQLIRLPNNLHVEYACSTAKDGFIEHQFALITEHDLTGHSSATAITHKRLSSRRRHAIDLLDLKPGDYVVHEQHGIGRFLQLEQRVIPSKKQRDTAIYREYLVIEYASSKRGAPADKLYVPTDQMDQISKYLGSDEPKLNKLGGSDWNNTKAKAKKHVKDIAQDLVNLYSVRNTITGYAYHPDTPDQRRLEESFPYQETPDQLRAIDDVKADMEKPIPMDRLISGDVGFGKTEIAVRAAFKAVQDGKQVAILAPTTLLVQQHEETFRERYANFPVTVGVLSRFQSAKETTKVMKGLADGTIDIVIGTHKLLNPKVTFHDLGLIIIDEEQRFGVEHKEKLKALRNNVDVLSMSATPIPRTLEMAVTGIRQMSTLTTPPEDRLPVLTYVGAEEDALITAAIRRELLRGGQVFFVHNRVSDIASIAEKLQTLVPEARIGIGHGKLSAKQLDAVINDFWENSIDILLCTTIIETGLDISNANTLIVDHADRYGLAQLHQLRGRVGRSHDRAYAYFLYDPTKAMTQVAHDRLTTIMQNTALGSGYDVALKDLELRGTGNLLGEEQSGHIAGVGFDLYIKMVSQAVTEYKDPENQEQNPITIDLPLGTSIPESYIESSKLRLEAYNKIAAAHNEEELSDIQDEFTDRYGTIPESVLTLFDITRLRWKAHHLGITDITTLGTKVRFAPIVLPESIRMRLARIYKGYVYRPQTHLVIIPSPFEESWDHPAMTPPEILTWVHQVLDDFSWHVSH